MKIIVDAMGGDNAPLEVLKGSALAVEQTDAEIILCGNEALLKEIIASNDISDKNFTFVDTGDCVVAMEDHAEVVVKSKKDSSMGVGLQMLHDGKGDAFVTAGSTGAALMGATLLVKRIKGVKRPAIGSVIPTDKGCSFLIDCGANAECKPEYLEQFGIMGSAYMKELMNVENPTVGLLNNGAEETKGTPMHIETNKLLKESSKINFAGNVEARGVPMGEVDVIVADGFSGNIFLKTFEGVGMLLKNGLKSVFYSSVVTKLCAVVIKKPLKKLLKRYDYSEYGGAPIMGVNGIVVKAHGSSDAKALCNAIKQSVKMAQSDIIGIISNAVSEK